MSENKDVEESAHNTQLCWVHTKWGRHQAKVLMETIQSEGHYVIVQMINNSFQLEESLKVFIIDQIEYI